MRLSSKVISGIILCSLVSLNSFYIDSAFAASMSSSSRSSSMGSSVRTSTPVRVSTPSYSSPSSSSSSNYYRYKNTSSSYNTNSTQSDSSNYTDTESESKPYNPCDYAIDSEQEIKEIWIKDFSFSVNYEKRETKYKNSNFHNILKKSKIKYLDVSSYDVVGTYSKKDENGCKVTVSKIASYVYGKSNHDSTNFLDLQLLFDDFAESISITLKDGSTMNVDNAFIILDDGTAFNLSVVPKPIENYISKTIFDYTNYKQDIQSFSLSFVNPKTQGLQSFNSESGDLILTNVDVKAKEWSANATMEEFFNPETNKNDLYETWYATFSASGNEKIATLESINKPLSKGLTVSPTEIVLLDTELKSFKINNKDKPILNKSFYVKKKDSDILYKIFIGTTTKPLNDTIMYVVFGILILVIGFILFLKNKNKIHPKDDVYL